MVEDPALAKLSPEERAAARIVSADVGGRVVHRDVPGAPGMTHDFDIVTERQTIAVEVTTSAHPGIISMWNAINQREWGVPTLKAHWMISVRQPGEHGPRIKELRKRAERLLATLEERGVEDFECRSPDRQLPEVAMDAIRRLAQLGVVRGRVLVANDGTGASLIHVTSSGGFTTGPTAIDEAVEKEVASNITKLRAADADERHLFVWIHSTSERADVALHSNYPPGPPTLPEGLDTVWLARPGLAGYEAPVYRLWRTNRGGEWEVLVPQA